MTVAALPGARLRSLDAFRGLTIAAMILVNNPGSWSHIYPPLAHAEWHGWTPTDLIFPFFIFIVGVSLTFSMARRIAAGAGRGRLFGKVLFRAGAIVAIGLLLNVIPSFDVSTMRIPGVLQRIGVVYLLTATAYLTLTPRRLRWLTFLLLAGYWAALLLIPVPGVGAGVLAREGNLAQYLDLQLLAGHLWTPRWDPEGILSTLPAVATCLLGVFTGDWLGGQRGQTDKALGLFRWGAGALAAGWALQPIFPINKNLWTSSYVLFSAGVALQLLALCYWSLEIRGRDGWAKPFYPFGTNALLAFVLSGLGARLLLWVSVSGPDGAPVTLKSWLYQEGFAAWAGPLNGSLAFAVAYLLLWYGLMLFLYRRHWFVRL